MSNRVDPDETDLNTTDLIGSTSAMSGENLSLSFMTRYDSSWSDQLERPGSVIKF